MEGFEFTKPAFFPVASPSHAMKVDAFDLLPRLKYLVPTLTNLVSVGSATCQGEEEKEVRVAGWFQRILEFSD